MLVVEDDTDLRDALCETLADSGHVVLTAVDGQEGLRQLRATRPDVVVLDLMMPGLDGWQFRLAQRKDPVLATIPVVAISGSSNPAAAAVDAELFLRKPIDGNMLSKAIEQVIAERDKRLAPVKAAEVDRLATLGTLAAGLAHEINNPLTYVLIRLTQIVRMLPAVDRTSDNPRVHELQELARGALEGAERIRAIMSAIRTFSRIDDIAMKATDVCVPLESALKLIANELGHRARVVKQYEEHPVVMANEGRLGQVFLNLLTNAMHAVPDGAPEQNEVRVVTSTDSAGHLVVEITDTGSGMPPHVLERVFDPFFSTKPVGQGTGLGLSISRNIIAQHGGTIGVTSEPDHGTTFRITLPALVPAGVSQKVQGPTRTPT
ncbi:MAG TPA: ATP-binding protein [Kofleriaceae bacterium]|nr:ATP-binding protein [Kofleriaceae bacterium]